MWDHVKQFWSAPVFDEDEGKSRSAALLNPLLIALFGIVIVGAIATAFIFAQKLGSAIAVLFLLGVVFASKLTLQRGWVRSAGIVFVVGMWLPLAIVTVLARAGSLYAVSFVSVTVVAGLILSQWAALIVAGASSLLVLAMVIVEGIGYEIPILFPSPLAANWVMLSLGLAMAVVPLNLALRILSEAVSRSRQYVTELEGQQEQLQTLVQDRSRDLARHTTYLRATIAVQDVVAVARDLEDLLARVVGVLSEHLDFYHVGLFMVQAVDAEGLELRAASGESGQQMLARGYRARVGEDSIVGAAARSREARILSQNDAGVTLGDHSDFPDTHSQIAVPLLVQSDLLGVLDMHSTESEVPSSEDVGVLQSLAAQIAVAIRNAQLLQQLQAMAERERRIRGELSQDAWMRFLREQPDLGYVSNQRGVFPVQESISELDASRSEVDQDVAYLTVPIQVSGQVVGVLEGRRASGWTAEERAMAETLGDQLNAAVERARLYRETQQRAARERLLREVTARVRSSTDPETVLGTLLREVGTIFGRSTFVRLGSAEELGRAPAKPQNGEGSTSDV
ncbi:MAG: GAF domain-containing protein [Anaerolineae bacterium]|nr:GAF domain-containing protein [Anaerolineae bacterium]